MSSERTITFELKLAVRTTFDVRQGGWHRWLRRSRGLHTGRWRYVRGENASVNHVDIEAGEVRAKRLRVVRIEEECDAVVEPLVQ